MKNEAVFHFFVVFFIVYSVYHLSAYPSIAGGDSGELMAEACIHGVPRKTLAYIVE